MSEALAHDDIEAQFRALYAAYAESLPAKAERMGESWRAWLIAPSADKRTELIRQAHTLAGSGATFGFLGVSSTARLLEAAFHRLDPTALPDDTQRYAIERAIEELAITARDHPPFPLPHFGPPSMKPVEPQETPGTLLWLVYRDEDDARRLADSLTRFGYRARRLQPEEIAAELGAESPLALLAEVGTGPDDFSGAQTLQTLRESLDHLPPAIFVSRCGDMGARLAAVRAGGAAYLTKPVDLTALLSLLRALSAPESITPYRVLIVDDDEHAAYHSALILSRAGLETKVVTDPLSILEAVQEFQPELILLDLYMRSCSGLELAQVLRQHSPFTGVAIVFFSVETGHDLHLQAMRLGGDDFLVKPIEPQRLVTAVEARARRTRTLLSLMRQDGLTGLLNHITYMDHLQRELARAQRYGHALCHVILDLDRFKQINDRHGHTAGDQVLRSLAQIFLQRLRRTDVIGRYGGEEFAVLMPETSIDTGHLVVEEVRATFSSLPYASPHGEFTATFSAGLAEYPACPNREVLLETADRALYRAKSKGRNRVEIGGVDFSPQT